MSNHIHIIVQSREGKVPDLMRYFKKFMAKTILDKIQNSPENRRDWMLERSKLAIESHTRNKNYQFLQYVNPAGEIYTNQFMWSKLDFIYLNPVVEGLFDKASHHLYSSASNFIYDLGFLKTEKADKPIVNVLEDKSFAKCTHD